MKRKLMLQKNAGRSLPLRAVSSFSGGESQERNLVRSFLSERSNSKFVIISPGSLKSRSKGPFDKEIWKYSNNWLWIIDY